MTAAGRPPPPAGPDEDREVPAMAESPALSASAYTLTGLLVFGGGGWLADRALGVSALLPIGLVVGVAVGLAMVWVRYGKSSNSPTGTPPTRASTASGQPPVPASVGRRPRPDPTTTYEERQ